GSASDLSFFSSTPFELFFAAGFSSSSSSSSFFAFDGFGVGLAGGGNAAGGLARAIFSVNSARAPDLNSMNLGLKSGGTSKATSKTNLPSLEISPALSLATPKGWSIRHLTTCSARYLSSLKPIFSEKISLRPDAMTHDVVAPSTSRPMRRNWEGENLIIRCEPPSSGGSAADGSRATRTMRKRRVGSSGWAFLYSRLDLSLPCWTS